ncbi:FAD:protein FMN transferase [Bifidobacterium sp. UTBIF-78]|uniref:FAD:protein FMN transferase n=1 Tax=Bifidobacterium sp. UTBIF-78 TaxID=1465263 RepID=UPI0021590A6D|nr:FAD:protein FMN transferase [Bifidobacterium sp. UTBIF-78]TPF93980.1 hypothetical protein BG22_06260 [Bifidobacterium sp. UTBIF-78]
MDGHQHRLPRTMAFPHALGTGLIIQSTLDGDERVPLPALLQGGNNDFATCDAPRTDGAASPTPHAAPGATPPTISLYDAIDILIDEYEAALSRFRAKSLVTRMRLAEHGGTFTFPDWCGPLFDLYDRLIEATAGAIDPCVGEDLIRLGYDAAYSFTVDPDAFGADGDANDNDNDNRTVADDGHEDGDATGNDTTGNIGNGGRLRDSGRLGALHGRATWRDDVERHGTTLITRQPVALDFGACGKGYLVDLIAEMLEATGQHRTQVAQTDEPAGRGDERRDADDEPDNAGHISGNRPDAIPTQPMPPSPQYVIDAGGDLLIHTDEPITIALEDPADPSNAVGTAEISAGAFCASSPSRRHWGEVAGHRLHHLLNAIDGLPVNDVAATWVAAPCTALADGLATALFVTPATHLRAHFHFECAVLNADHTAAQSPDFPGSFFVK